MSRSEAILYLLQSKHSVWGLHSPFVHSVARVIWQTTTSYFDCNSAIQLPTALVKHHCEYNNMTTVASCKRITYLIDRQNWKRSTLFSILMLNCVWLMALLFWAVLSLLNEKRSQRLHHCLTWSLKQQMFQKESLFTTFHCAGGLAVIFYNLVLKFLHLCQYNNFPKPSNSEWDVCCCFVF